MVDLRLLGYFLCACESESLSGAADELGIAPSTLSASLKSLEQELSLSLLRKRGSGVSPQVAARWLFRAGLPLLLLEGFARRRMAETGGDEPAILRLDVGLRFAFGRVSKAITRAIALTAQAEPLILVHPEWVLETGPKFAEETAQALEIRDQSRIFLGAVPRAADASKGEISLISDPWLIVRRNLTSEPPEHWSQIKRDTPIAVPLLPPEIMRQVEAYAMHHGLSEFRFIDGHPAALPQLMEDNPGLSFLLPSTAVAARLGMTGLVAAPIDPPLNATIVGKITVGDAVARRFLSRLRVALESPETTTVFDPEITTRRLRYFNLAHAKGQVSAAAKSAGVAQPALSQQLNKLEETVGAALFERKPYGLSPTPLGARFAPMSMVLERQVRELTVGALSVAMDEGRRLSLGILPSVNQHGLLLNRTTEALVELRRRYPTISFSVQEAPNKTLQGLVTQGQIGMAIVETLLPHLPRMPLNTAEDLAVIVDPRHGLLPPGPVSLKGLGALPLVLTTNVFGIRQLLDDMARTHDVDLRPRDEIDSLAMIIAQLMRDRICTVMPPSAVAPELASGRLQAHPIVDPAIPRRLFAIYSADRSLTAAERAFVGLLREGFAAPGEDSLPEPSPKADDANVS